jgi:hypothetical protein
MRNNLRLIVWGSGRLSLFCCDTCNTLEIEGTVQRVHAVTASHTGKVTRIRYQQGTDKSQVRGQSCSETSEAPTRTSRNGRRRTHIEEKSVEDQTWGSARPGGQTPLDPFAMVGGFEAVKSRSAVTHPKTLRFTSGINPSAAHTSRRPTLIGLPSLSCRRL